MYRREITQAITSIYAIFWLIVFFWLNWRAGLPENSGMIMNENLFFFVISLPGSFLYPGLLKFIHSNGRLADLMMASINYAFVFVITYCVIGAVQGVGKRLGCQGKGKLEAGGLVPARK